MTAPRQKTGAPKRAVAVKSAPKRKTKNPLLTSILSHLEDAKAEDIVTIDLNGKAVIADGMIVASGRSNRHVGAIADQLVEKLKGEGHKDLRVEGLPHADWVLVDAGDIVVHIFRPEVRSFYNLEKLWSDHAPDERVAV
ncbi:ribosome silencing factor [Aestuariivirga sp. YIM B02566]|uniref:Ribosome silencing factor n=1 Tax=Taklimakanibacter albus TaxID=2800327 RepID=A0ACC5R8Q8_9HYPH|nr:ribosome silencing factor [Aestuariivirga sp. YIM B02566]MBK1869037.1 ribosome silencing factor [Aestuariivirga sp. YIM B02566]